MAQVETKQGRLRNFVKCDHFVTTIARKSIHFDDGRFSSCACHAIAPGENVRQLHPTKRPAVMGSSPSPRELQKLKFSLTDLVPSASVVACFTTLIIYESRQSNIESLLKRPKTPSFRQEFLELAEVCEEVANNIDDRRASG